MDAPLLLRPGEGETISDGAERTVLLLADAEPVTVTYSRYVAGERGPDAHVHHYHSDAFYVLDGALVFGLGPDAAERVEAPAGAFVLVPTGVVHTFVNEGPGEARFLNVHAPNGGFAEHLRAERDGREPAVAFDTDDPPPGGGRPASDAIVRGPGEGDALALGASRTTFKAEGTDGDGTFSLSENVLAPGFPGPVPHRHETFLDSFYVLEGTLTLRLGDETLAAPPGSFAAVPPGKVHTFSNPRDETVRVLNLMAPGGFEQYLRDVAREARQGQPDPERMAAIASRSDFHPA